MNSLMENDLDITVCDPEKHADGLGAYVTYKVVTQTSRPEFKQPSFYTRRRYNDFKWLRQMLEESCPYNIIPPLPEKHAMNRMSRFKPEFLESRRQGLEQFLRRCASHPILSTNEYFVAFCEAANWELASKQKGGKLLSGIAENIRQLAAKMVMKDQDPRFADVADYVSEFAEYIAEIDKLANRLTKDIADYATDLSNFGPTFTLLSNCETELRDPLVAVSKTVELDLASAKDHANAMNDGFTRRLHEYVLYADSILSLLQRRDAAHVHAELAEDELAKRRRQLEASEAGEQKASVSTLLGSKNPEQARQERITRLHAQIAELEGVVAESQEDLRQANESVLADLERWHLAKDTDFKSIFAALADSEIAYNRDAAAAWEALIPVLQEI